MKKIFELSKEVSHQITRTYYATQSGACVAFCILYLCDHESMGSLNVSMSLSVAFTHQSSVGHWSKLWGFKHDMVVESGYLQSLFF